VNEHGHAVFQPGEHRATQGKEPETSTGQGTRNQPHRAGNPKPAAQSREPETSRTGQPRSHRTVRGTKDSSGQKDPMYIYR
jgi:hypothetical protein